MMKKKVVSFLFESIKSPFTIFSIGAVSVMVVDTFTTTSISDAISSTANVVMAITACRALYVGRNYLSNLADNDAYKVAFDIKDVIIPKLRNKSGILTLYRKFICDFDEFSSCGSTNFKLAKMIYNQKELLVRRHFELININRELNLALSKLSGYGWGSTQGKVSTLDAVKINFKDAIELCEQVSDLLEDLMGDVFGVDPIDFILDFDLEKSSISENFNVEESNIYDIKILVSSIEDKKKIIDETLSKYFNGEPYIGLFFERVKY
ncbi:hypothetical protein NUF60_000201 [Yersinia enterocolitica]|uniref:hypothetical protein n=1 Tax=Yersinia enterocolitica TaxID=630 RepID=UPI002A7751A6|nr:hypothetical protein [Yersinia enterocolitica]ELZ1905893.1 hypothetical protein [Yersinia enterocolitica]HDL7967948.1 hypothetical protein [Yersinia enterocolitica]HEN3595596.1 hypothetical protein [Yersinia enterocolitica]